MIYFTADQHFDHMNIPRFCGRPWSWYWKMNKALIDNFNSVVTDDDDVWHLGDFAWKSDPVVYTSRLKGKTHNLIMGNHDNRQKCLKTFHSVKDVDLLKIKGYPPIWLSHYAHRIWPQRNYGALHLFGHSHGILSIPPEEKCLDVGVDAWNYYPVSLDQIIKYLQNP
jgi:calcineurin-like phosphoesterase family protein